MTKEQLKSLNINIDIETDFIMANAALEWIAENTTIDIEDIENMPYSAKAFIEKYCEMTSTPVGVSSQSIEGLSQSFTSGNKENEIWDLANSLFPTKLKSKVRFVFAQRKWR